MKNHQLKIDKISSRNSIKSYILKHSVIEYKCFECPITNIYNNKPIVLHLDHINGINNDNRLENLRFLCPNCHSQTTTYCGKNIGQKTNICNCGKNKYYYALRCKECDTNFRLNNGSKKIKWPEISYLISRSKEIGFVALGKELGVSDNAIRKHIKKRI